MKVPKFVSECLVSKGIREKSFLTGKESMLYIQPCISERGRIMLDVQLNEVERFLDSEKLCSLLEAYRRSFAEYKCSRKLGIAKLRWKGREIIISKKGRIKIRRVLNRNEIPRLVNLVCRLIWGSVICSVCKNPALICASGKCNKCIIGERNVEEVSDFFLEAEKKLRNGNYSMAMYFAFHSILEAPTWRDAIPGLVLLGMSFLR